MVATDESVELNGAIKKLMINRYLLGGDYVLVLLPSDIARQRKARE